MLISVIIQAYQVEQYLEKCIKSVTAQTYKALEIIVIYKGSDDYFYSLCSLYKNLDSRITIIKQEDKGLVNGRKLGASHASGEYILHVDGDDWMEKDYIEKLVQASEKGRFDMVCAGHWVTYPNEEKIVYNKIPTGQYQAKKIIDKLFFYDVFYEFGITPYVWSKLLRTDIVKKIHEEIDGNICLGEDVAVVFPAVLNSNEIIVTSITGMHYVQRKGSGVRTGDAFEKQHNRALMQFLNFKFSEFYSDTDLYHLLNRYCKLIWLFRSIEHFDQIESELILTPVGGLQKESKVIIYGAGSLGQSIYSYLKNRKDISVAAWIDKDYMNLQSIGFDIASPSEIDNCEYDYIVLGCASEKTAEAITEYLLQKNVKAEKIKWLTKEFLSDDYNLLSEVLDI